MEILGLEPDLQNRKLRVLPMDAEQTFLSILSGKEYPLKPECIN